MNRPIISKVAAVFLAGLLIFLTPLASVAGICAISGTVHGKVTQVGYREMLFKLAKQYKLAGWVQNRGNNTYVAFMLQTNCKKLAKLHTLILHELYFSNKHACVKEIKIKKQRPIANLTTFTIYGWTSKSRCFHTPKNIIYTVGHKQSFKSLIKQFKPKGGWACHNKHSDKSNKGCR